MRTLDRSKPYTNTFGPDTSTIPFFQNGLYYNHQGNLVDNKHNRLHLASLGINADQFLAAPAASAVPAASEPGVQNVPVADTNADTNASTGHSTTLSLSSLEPPADDPDPLAGHTDVQVFGLAQRLRAQLDVSEDGDNYVPTLDNAKGNREFVIRHLKGEGQE